MMLSTRRALLVASIAFGLAACGKDEATDPLAYVPADTPYVVANRIVVPKAVTEAWMGMYGSDFGEIYQNLAEDQQVKKIDGEMGVWLRASLPEFANMTSIDGIEGLGLKIEARLAFYGYGLMPVYRLELADAKRFTETVARIEKRAGKALAKRKIDDVELWQFSDDKATVLFGPIGQFLVITLAPAGADEARLKAQLGLTLPESSLAKSGGLEALDKQYGYDGHMSGYVDIRGLTQRLSGRNQDDNAVITAFGGEIPKLSDACASELDSMTQKFPRMVFGSTDFSAKRLKFNGVVEMEQALAASMQKLSAPIPGADSTDPMMFRLALSVDLPETVRFLGGIADSIAAEPFQCEELADLNASAAEMKQNLANPGLAMAGAMTAIHLGVRTLKIDPGASMPTELSAFATLGSSSPVMLWGFAQQGVPALAKVQITTDGKIVALPADALPMPMPLELKAIMTDKSFGVATSDIADASFTAAATMPANKDGTILRYGVSGDLFKLIAASMPEEDVDADGDEAKAKAKEAEDARKMLTNLSEHLDQVDVRLGLTDKGIVFSEEVTLK
ncbi:MAG: hypothetical protein H7A19_07715 [Rhodanobacteraceae bacterium]|nr:hypothetical protein [Rhodanobacteraceae bacterium]